MVTTPKAASGDATSSSEFCRDDQHADADDGQHRASLRRPQDPSDGRVDRARRVERNRRRFEEALPGRRLDVGQQFLVRLEAIEQLVVHFGLDLRQPRPAAVFDECLDQPEDAAADQQHHGADREALESPCATSLPPGPGRSAGSAVPVAVALGEEVSRIVPDLRVLRQDRPPEQDTAAGTPGFPSRLGSRRRIRGSDGGYCRRSSSSSAGSRRPYRAGRLRLGGPVAVPSGRCLGGRPALRGGCRGWSATGQSGLRKAAAGRVKRMKNNLSAAYYGCRPQRVNKGSLTAVLFVRKPGLSGFSG